MLLFKRYSIDYVNVEYEDMKITRRRLVLCIYEYATRRILIRVLEHQNIRVEHIVLDLRVALVKTSLISYTKLLCMY